MLAALALVLFVAFLAFIAVAPHQLTQIFLFLSWCGMLLTVLYQVIAGLLA